jgi:hypothetical protein
MDISILNLDKHPNAKHKRCKDNAATDYADLGFGEYFTSQPVDQKSKQRKDRNEPDNLQSVIHIIRYTER